MKNQVKVTKVQTHKTPQAGTIECAEAELVLVEYNDTGKFNQGAIPLTHCVNFSHDKGNASLKEKAWYFPIIIVSDKPERGDFYWNGKEIRKAHLVSDFSVYYGQTKEDQRKGLCESLSDCKKVVAFAENFSTKQLGAIEKGKLREGRVLIECEVNAYEKKGKKIQYAMEAGDYTENTIKLDAKNQITLHKAPSTLQHYQNIKNDLQKTLGTFPYPPTKELYVTIQEFLDNGGELKPEREIYTQKQESGKFWQFGYFLKQAEEGYLLIKNATWNSFPINLTTFFVKIEATPIYK